VTDLRLEALAHVYPSGVRALDGADLAVTPGERVALVGQNGSGKTTLARHLNGLLRPTAGRVLVGGVDAASLRVGQLSRIVGLAFQNPDDQIFARTVAGEVEFGARNARARGDAGTAARRALEAVGLQDAGDLNPYDLGYSKRKLLTIASVLAMETPVLVLDEPTTGQDARGVGRVAEIVRMVSEAGRTVIVISHDMRFVAEHFERVVVMRAGRVILDGPPADVFAERNWEFLRSTYLEPTLSARVGAALGLGSTPTDSSLVQALSQAEVVG
jgi:energy-coupling factor transport system ATP-binding protein